MVLCPPLHLGVVVIEKGANFIYIYIYERTIGIMVRVLTNGPGNRGSIRGRVIPKALKWYLMPPCFTLGIIRYGSRVKWTNSGKGVAPSPTSRCCSYWKGGLQVAYNHGHQLCLYIYKQIIACKNTTKMKYKNDTNDNVTPRHPIEVFSSTPRNRRV